MINDLLNEVDHALDLVVALFFLLLFNVVLGLPEVDLERLVLESEGTGGVVHLNALLSLLHVFVANITFLEVHVRLSGLLVFLSEVMKFE